jgi:hypothetical protein
MNKRNIILLAVSLIVLITAVSAVSASDDTQISDMQIQDDSTDIITSDNVEQTNTKQLDTAKETKNIKSATYTVTDDNYGRYFSQDDGTTTKIVKANDTIKLSGVFNEKEFFIDKPGITLVGEKNSIINNGRIFITEDAGNNTITNITINTTGYDNAIFIEAEGVVIKNNKITITNTDGITEGIKNEANNVIISNNIVNVYGAAIDVTWGSGDREDLPYTLGIYTSGSNSTIENNKVFATLAKDAVNENYGTIDGIEVQGDISSIPSNITIRNNTVNVTDGRFVYAINVLRYLDNVKVIDNKISAYGERYVDGVQMGNYVTNSIIENNDVYGYCFNKTEFDDDNEAIGFGIITTCMGGGPSYNITVKNNKIVLNSTITYGIEVFKSFNCTYDSNNITGDGLYSMGIGISRCGDNNYTNNEINLTGNSLSTVNYIVEDIRPANTGIHIQIEADNSIISGNNIKIYDKQNKSIGVCVVNTNNVRVTNNDLVANTNYGDNAVKVDKGLKNVTVKNNTSPFDKKDAIITIQAPKKVDTGKTIKINLTITDTQKTPANGTAVIKINGLSIKDINTNTSAIPIKNGKGTLTMTLASYSGKEYTITAIFSKTGYNRAENTTKMTVNKGTYKTFTIKLNGTSEQKIKIKQTLTDTNGNKIYGNTQVAIKLGDRTVKTLTVSNSILETEITVPYLPPGENKFKITLGENYRYNTKIINSTINISKQDVEVKITPIKGTPGKTITLKATLTNKNTKTPVISGKYLFKVNGKTVPIITEFFDEIYTTKNITKGIAQWNYTIPNSMNPGTYEIMLSYNGNTQSNPIKYTSKALTVA